jgi:hypothetical protein
LCIENFPELKNATDPCCEPSTHDLGDHHCGDFGNSRMPLCYVAGMCSPDSHAHCDLVAGRHLANDLSHDIDTGSDDVTTTSGSYIINLTEVDYDRRVQMSDADIGLNV